MNRLSYVVRDYFIGFSRMTMGISVPAAPGGSGSASGGRSATGLMAMGTDAPANIAPVTPNGPLIPIEEPPSAPPSKPSKPPKPPKEKKK